MSVVILPKEDRGKVKKHYRGEATPDTIHATLESSEQWWAYQGCGNGVGYLARDNYSATGLKSKLIVFLNPL